jgi:hypothetical protein
MPYAAARWVPQKKMVLLHQITGGFVGVVEAMREKGAKGDVTFRRGYCTVY